MSKRRVTKPTLKYRAAMTTSLAQQENEGIRRQTASREQVLTRLWEIANLNPEMTRNSAAAQIKALSLIIAIEGLIPDRRAPAPEKKPAFPPVTGDFYKSEWFRAQEERDANPQAAPGSASQPPAGIIADIPADRIFTHNPDPAPTPAPTTRWVPDAFKSDADPRPKTLRTTFPFHWGR